MLAKWLMAQPRVLFLDEPTRGIDVGAKAEIYQVIAELAARGLGVVLVSSDLPELLGMSHRVLVLSQGRPTARPRGRRGHPGDGDGRGHHEGLANGRDQPLIDPAPPPVAVAAPPRPRIPWRALTMVGALLVIWIVFSLMTEGTFLKPRNLSLLARQMAVTSILAIGMVLVIVAGQIDLSVGALAGLLGAVSAMAFTNHDWPLSASFALVLVLGAILGCLQGSLVAWLRSRPSS